MMKIITIAALLLLSACDLVKSSSVSGGAPNAPSEVIERQATLQTLMPNGLDSTSRIDIANVDTGAKVATVTPQTSSLSVAAGATYRCDAYLYLNSVAYCDQTPISGTVTIAPTQTTASCRMVCVRAGQSEFIDTGVVADVSLMIDVVTPHVLPQVTLTRLLSLVETPEKFAFQFVGDAIGFFSGTAMTISNAVVDHDYYEAQVVAPLVLQAGDVAYATSRVLANAGAASTAGIRSELVHAGDWVLAAGKTLPVSSDMVFTYSFTAPADGVYQWAPLQAGFGVGDFQLVAATIDVARVSTTDPLLDDWHYAAAEEAAASTSEGGGGINPLLAYAPDPSNTAAFATGLGWPVNAGHRYTTCSDGDGLYDYRIFRSNKPCWGTDVTDRHLGLDVNGEGGGNTDLGLPVLSLDNGVVLSAGWVSSSWGNVIVIGYYAPAGKSFRLADGSLTDRFFVLFAHVQNMAVSKGDVVKKGQQVAEIGKYCGATCLAHLHVETLAGVAAMSAPVPGPGYLDSRVCSDIDCGRVEPRDFLERNATLTSSCSGTLNVPVSGSAGQTVTVAASTTCASTALTVTSGGVTSTLATFSSATTKSYTLSTGGSSVRFALVAAGLELAAQIVTIVQPVILTAPFLLDPLLVRSGVIAIQAVDSYAGDGLVTEAEIVFGTFAGNTSAPFDPARGEGNAYGTVAEIQWPLPEHVVGTAGSGFTYCYRARMLRRSGGQILGTSPWSNQACRYVP